MVYAEPTAAANTPIGAINAQDETQASNPESSRPIVINNFVGFLGSFSTPVLDLNDTGLPASPPFPPLPLPPSLPPSQLSNLPPSLYLPTYLHTYPLPPSLPPSLILSLFICSLPLYFSSSLPPF